AVEELPAVLTPLENVPPRRASTNLKKSHWGFYGNLLVVLRKTFAPKAPSYVQEFQRGPRPYLALSIRPRNRWQQLRPSPSHPCLLRQENRLSLHREAD